MRRSIALTPLLVALASCVPAPPAPPPPPAPPRPTPVAALPAAAPQQDWRDVGLTPGTWLWRGTPVSVARFGVAGGTAVFTVRCDAASRTVTFVLPGASAATTMRFTSSFGVFALAVQADAGAITAATSARDPHLDQLAFSRGRFLVDVAGMPRLVLPAWPEVERVIEDCRV